MSSSMKLKGASLSMSGKMFPALMSAVSTATTTYLMTASIETSTNMVLGPGAGTTTGRLSGLVPSTMAQLMRLKAASMSIAGRDIAKLFNSVSFGVVQALKTAIVQGTVIGGGPGRGTGKILGLVPSVLMALILAQSSVRTIAGRDIRKIASAMAFGICTHIMTNGIVNQTCIGAAAGPPVGPVSIPVAPGTGRLV